MLNRVASIEAIGPAAPQNGAMYPNTTYGRQLRDVAHIIRSGLGLEVATVDIGGWDTHDDQGARRWSHLGTRGKIGRALRRNPGVLCRSGTADEQRGSIDLYGIRSDRSAKMPAVGPITGRARSGLSSEAESRAASIMARRDFHLRLLTPISIQGDISDPTVEFRDLFSDVLVRHFGVNTGELANVFPGHTHVPVGVFV